MAKLDEEIDRLFQLPLTEFTGARNALAKASGKDGAAIKALAKPPVAAWAVNQLYWKERAVYDALTDTALQVRKAHTAVMEGKNADLRVTGRMHEEAIEAALKATIAVMKEDGQPVTDATRHTILNTLRALPADEPPGRLTRTLTPGGFEMLAGIQMKPGGRPAKAPAAAPSARAKPDTRAGKEAAREREQKLALERAVREADQKARHAEFEAARAARDATKAEKKLEEAQRAHAEAQAALREAERDASAAAKAKDAADRRARDANSALDAARAKLQSA